MVGGAEIFRQHFAGFEAHYVLIGGGACDLLHDALGLQFRPTKDFDIVLNVEALASDKTFMQKIWDFVIAGEYEIRQRGENRQLYRFIKPKTKDYPHQIELFSRRPDVLTLPSGALLTPIPGGDEISSLSAILISETSYQFLMQGTTVVQGVRTATADRLIALKAVAWTNLKSSAGPVDKKDIIKHRKDIYRLARLLEPDTQVELPVDLAGSLRAWIEEGRSAPLDVKDPALDGRHEAEYLALIHSVFFNRDAIQR
jgi:hypothetical protein